MHASTYTSMTPFLSFLHLRIVHAHLGREHLRCNEPTQNSTPTRSGDAQHDPVSGMSRTSSTVIAVIGAGVS
ncbi:hypothetical protein F5Y08DRAFT_301225 [Xylaria arbuscula]|nr:hypothetical protein F5Y08DRAFT_301225 [Xylaria arbuscula]